MDGIQFVGTGGSITARRGDDAGDAIEELRFKERSRQRKLEKEKLLSIIAANEMKGYASSGSSSDERKKSKKSKKSKSRDVEKARGDAGLDWFSFDPPTVTAPKVEMVAPKVEDPLDARIEQEVKAGLRDPVSKRPYGLFDPKTQTIQAQLETPVGKATEKIEPAPLRDPNKLAAQALRAKLSGNMALFNKLQEEIKEIKQRKATAPAPQTPNVAVLAPMDAKGRYLGTLEGTEAEKTHIDLRKRRRGVYRDGELEKREQDMTVEEMLRREKQGGSDSNLDENYLKNLMKTGKQIKPGRADRSGANEDFEDVAEIRQNQMYQSKRARMTDARAMEHDRIQAINARRQVERAETKCPFSINSKSFKKHLVVEFGQHVYIMLVPHPIVKYHCRIVPIEPIASMTTAGQAVFEEVNKLKRALETIFLKQKQSLVYLETVINPKRPGWHTCIECIPLDEEEAELVPIFFKKALLEAGDQWAGNHQKLIDTSSKPISHCIPPDFAYFHVEWGGGGYKSGGYAHSIEEPAKYKADFGTSVVCGLVGREDYRYEHHQETVKQEKDRVNDFQTLWQQGK